MGVYVDTKNELKARLKTIEGLNVTVGLNRTKDQPQSMPLIKILPDDGVFVEEEYDAPVQNFQKNAKMNFKLQCFYPITDDMSEDTLNDILLFIESIGDALNTNRTTGNPDAQLRNSALSIGLRFEDFTLEENALFYKFDGMVEIPTGKFTLNSR